MNYYSGRIGQPITAPSEGSTCRRVLCAARQEGLCRRFRFIGLTKVVMTADTVIYAKFRNMENRFNPEKYV